MAVAGDVPNKFDVVLNGEGYRFYDSAERQPFSSSKGIYSYSPTFVQRQNTQGDYGDNQQDFWLTWTQRDWSLGEQQKFYRQTEEGTRRYYAGDDINVIVEGEVTVNQDVREITSASGGYVAHVKRGNDNDHFVLHSTNLYEINHSTGGITDHGAHGLGVTPQYYAFAADHTDLYFSGDSSGLIRKWNSSAFSTFASFTTSALVFHNNNLYGLGNGAELGKITAGTWTTLHTWLDADGAGVAITAGRMVSYGGRILWLMDIYGHVELWQYDGVGASKLHTFPEDFTGTELEVVHGTVYIGGTISRLASANTNKQVVYAWQNGTVAKLWEAENWNVNTRTRIAAFRGGLAILAAGDSTISNGWRILLYRPETGGVHCASIPYAAASSDNRWLGASANTLLVGRDGGTDQGLWPHSTSIVDTATVYSSLIDFDSSLNKYVRTVKIDAELPTGATIDLAYRVNDLAADTYTSIQVNALSGVEYPINVSARSISIKVTLNRTSTDGPTLKKVSLRAVPVLQTFKRRQYLFDLSGKDGESHIKLRDNTTAHVKDGRAMADDLNTAAVLTTPFSITDRFATYTGIIEPDGFELIEIRPDEFVARVSTREV